MSQLTLLVLSCRYDLYDLGEFDQKGGVGTKWGTKEQLLSLTKKAKELDIGIYLDAVLNHKAGADHKEKCRVMEVAQDNEQQDLGEPYEMEAWLGFDFPGRGDKYSKLKYQCVICRGAAGLMAEC